MEYKIKRSLTGAVSIHLTCPKCIAPVVFDLDDAGDVHPCPACKAGIRVPGESEKQAEVMRRKAKEAEERQQAEAKHAAVQAQRIEDARREAEAAVQAKRKNHELKEAARWRYTGLTASTVLLGLIGVICMLVAGAMETSVRSGDFGRVENIGLLNTRLCLVIGGCASLLGCIVTGSASAIIQGMGQFAYRLDSRLANRPPDRD